MEDERAQKIIQMAAEEETKAANFKSLYQEVADLMYPCENQITGQTTPGSDKSRDIRDPTGIFALDDMVAGLIGTWIPAGQSFFGVKAKDRRRNTDRAMRYMALTTEIAHEEMFESNFMLQLHDTVKALAGFGTGNMYSEWDNKSLGLNYKDWHISTYTIKQNSRGMVDTMILTYNLTARQAAEEFTNPGEKVLQNANDIKNESKRHTFIHVVRPRNERCYHLTDSLNMPFESLYINKDEKIVVEESGFDEFPFAVPRWEKSSIEKYGRGRGTVMLSAVKELQQMHKDFVECGNRWNNPSRWQVDDDIEGTLNNSPGALNHFMKAGAAGALDSQLNGNFPITEKVIGFQQELVNRGFYKDIFVQLADLKGDRRTTVEIEARLKEGLRRLVSPVARMESELFTPLITRSILLLIRNGRIPPPPPELSGAEFGIEYMGELALAMRNYQARAFTQFTSLVADMAPVFPEATDVLNLDRALPNIGLTMGVRVDDLNTPEEIAEKRAKRAQDELEQKLAMAAQVGSEAYKNTSKAPESGSPAEMVGV